jgi:hypothetical protein
MSVTVPCPTCAAFVNVRAEYIGRTVRCPQCKTLLDSSGRTRVAPQRAPVVATPRRPDGVVVRSPAPEPARRSRSTAARKNDDGVPLRRRTRRDESGGIRPWVWVLLAVGGVAAIGLTGAGGYVALNHLAAVKPGVNRTPSQRAEDPVDAPIRGPGPAAPVEAGIGIDTWVPRQTSTPPVAADAPPANQFPDGFVGVTPQNAKKIRLGMTFAEVEAILGKIPDGADGVSELHKALRRVDGDAHVYDEDYWQPLVVNKSVAGWASGPVVIALGLDGPRSPTAKVIAVVGAVGHEAKPDWTIKQLTPRPKQPPIETTPLSLLTEYAKNPTEASAKYGGRLVRLSWQEPGLEDKKRWLLEFGPIKYDVWLSYSDKTPTFKPGDFVTVIGRVSGFGNGGDANRKTIYVNKCKLAE